LPEKFVPDVEDHQSLYRSILASLHAGEPGEKLYDSLEAKRRQEFVEATKEISLPGSGRDLMMAKLIAEQDILGSWRNHGDRDSVHHFSRCLRTPPFTITRKN
jgi:hypothetical protein